MRQYQTKQQAKPQHATAIHKPLHDDGALFVIQLYAGGIDLFLRDNQLVFQFLIFFFNLLITLSLCATFAAFLRCADSGVIDIGEFIGQSFDLIFQIWHTGAQAWFSAVVSTGSVQYGQSCLSPGIIGVGVSL